MSKFSWNTGKMIIQIKDKIQEWCKDNISLHYTYRVTHKDMGPESQGL